MFSDSIAFCVLLSFVANAERNDLELLQCSLAQESYCGNSKKKFAKI